MRANLRDRVSDAGKAFRGVVANPDLRRLQLAWLSSLLGVYAYTVALAVYAYRDGGAGAVAVAALVRWVPAALAAPFTALLADRYPRRRVMTASSVIRALTFALMAITAASHGPASLVYALAAIAPAVATAFRPAQAALLPALARTPDQLTAANVASSAIQSVSGFAGPALGGLVLVFAGEHVVFAVTAGALLWSAVLVARISTEDAELSPVGRSGRLAHELGAGVRAIADDRALALLVGLIAVQTLVYGSLSVLIVVAALKLLGTGAAGVGVLNSASGLGGLVGALVAGTLLARRRPSADFALGLVLWGLPIALIAVWPQQGAAFALLTVVGVGNTLVDVAGYTLLQRAVPDEVLARVFGVLESLVLVTSVLGAILAPVLIAAVGIRGALAAIGAPLPLLAAIGRRRLGGLDAIAAARERRLELLGAVAMFAPLSPKARERLASQLVAVSYGAGEEVLRQGDPGERFYLVAAGEAEVIANGRRGPTLGPGDFFGEIALLRAVPRTATVRARTDLELLALDGDDFVATMTSNPESAAAAEAVIGNRLASLQAGVGPV